MLSLLLIEDDQDDVDLFQFALKDAKLEVSLTVVMQGDEALPTLSQLLPNPDVIVMDLNLPIIQGRDILARIRQEDGYKHIPILVLTTSSSREEKSACLALGADAFVTKPTSIDGFRALISTVKQLAIAA